ncbi:hypothetical protein Aple_092290 [Acrocarpospora pleiomorpha]|uniref:Uncharacterized protein n=1 Tax=Acrocarpospora pleiomorpha TaxID=90975 RepID=A0A5M3XZ80_9ACTN|nr:hypothetical protein Aple_092290 [Acrocarpospora pleiomorpha]
MGRLPLRVDTRRLKADTPHPKADTRHLVDISNSSLVISNSLVDISSSSPVDISSPALTRRLVDTRPPALTTRRWACHSRRESRRHLPSGGSDWWRA